MILAAEKKSRWARYRVYTRLSGPGWLQGAITLGGGSLAGSLYLGIIGGYELMWLQPLMMIFGIVMLSAIAYVTLSTGVRPFDALNRHVSPVLGWGWAIATLMANMVWAMPQFSLGTAALRQNLGILSFPGGEYLCALLLIGIGAYGVWLYDSSSKGYKVFDVALKVMVGVIVISFFLVVIVLTTSGKGLPWGSIFAGFIPNPGLVFEPASSLAGFVTQSSNPDFWHSEIVSAQRDRMVAAAATAVGINMTFLLPYSLMKRRWDKNFRGLARFDLSTGLFVPFLLATSCVVIAASTQFHANPEHGLIEVHRSGAVEVPARLQAAYEANLTKMLAHSGQEATPALMGALPEADRLLAATLIQRDAFALANSLQNLAGAGFAQIVFGIGVVGMAVSTIIILMLINGFVICELAGKPTTGKLYRGGCLLAALTGAIGALFLWSGKAQFYLAVPTSRFGMVFLPIAYIAFFFLMNNKKLLGNDLPRGASRTGWNLLMIVAVLLSLSGAAISILNDKTLIPGTDIAVRNVGLIVLGLLFVWGLVLHFKRKAQGAGGAKAEG